MLAINNPCPGRHHNLVRDREATKARKSNREIETQVDRNTDGCEKTQMDGIISSAPNAIGIERQGRISQ